MRIYILIIVLSVISVALIFKKDNPQVVNKVKKLEKIVETKVLEKTSYSKKLKLRGFTEASRIVIIKSQVEGRISSKNFDKGKFYKAGAQLLLIDPEDKVAKVKEMEALLNQRKKNMKFQKVYLKRI